MFDIIFQFVIPFIISVISVYIGYLIGRRQGEIAGMQEFVSIIKVYSPSLRNDLQELLTKISSMSSEEKEKIFKDYIAKFYNEKGS